VRSVRLTEKGVQDTCCPDRRPVERNHQGLGNELVDGIGVQPHSGRVLRRQRIGGLLSYYYRAA
jgi:hypothetical protein